MIKVIKKDKTIEVFDQEKIKAAVSKAAFRCDKKLSDGELQEIANCVLNHINCNEVSVSTLHEIVIASLHATGNEDIAEKYSSYRYYKLNFAHDYESIKQDADDVLRLGDRENANFDSSLVSTKGSLIKGYLTKTLYKRFYLSDKESELIKRGDIYIHDLRDMILGCVNCCLFDVAKVMKGGFTMSNVDYTEPKTVLAALQLIGDITLVATAQQFGGFTLAEIDKVLLPYVYKSYNKHFARYSNDCELPVSKADKLAKQDTIRELEQGFQSLELKLNTVPCSRGDFAFTTLTFAQWNVNLSNEDKFWLKTICSTILKTRRQGHGANGKPVVFPKLVYLYDHLQVKYDTYSAELFDEAVKTSAECMYPDYLAINSEYGTVSRLFKEQGVITSPMGCRAYLSPWKNDEGKYITIGRCNIGAVSLNLPLILKQTQLRTENWQEEFWVDLKNCMDVIRNFLKKRYDIIRKQKCSSNPLAYTQGGFYEGTKHMDDEVGDLVRYMTASFGITALDEFTYLWTNERLCERQDIAKRALDFIQKTVNQYKEEDGYLYALYGTPAESLCATQAKQFDQFCKDNSIENPFANHEHYSIEYFTNSFHCNVTEDITPIEKQNKEFECFHNCEGGHIQYVRLDNPSNLQAVKKIIERGMEMGFYQGVNFDSAYCNDCGKHSTNVLFKCPHCGSSNISVISRVCGYLGYSNVNGHSRMNDGKMEEIVNRVSM